MLCISISMPYLYLCHVYLCYAYIYIYVTCIYVREIGDASLHVVASGCMGRVDRSTLLTCSYCPETWSSGTVRPSNKQED